MSEQLTDKRYHIIVSASNYEALRTYGKVKSTFNEAVSEVLRLAQINRNQVTR